MWTLSGNNYWQNLTFIKGFKCSAMWKLGLMDK
jgi:hypothetical protein